MTDADVLIVGAGIMGAVTASMLRGSDPDLRILMVDAGDPIGDTPGEHLHESTDPAVQERYHRRIASGIQGLYVGDETFQPPAESRDEIRPGMHRLSVLGHLADDLPGMALGYNAGGMGIHWTAATPRPGAHERFGDLAAWDDDLTAAERLLHVEQTPLPPTNAGTVVLDALARAFPSGGPDETARTMPMAVTTTGARRVRSSPATIYPPIADPSLDERFELLTGTIADALEHDGRRVAGARLRRLDGSGTRTVRARAVVVCADALRTPQLLFASGIRPPALGRYLNEHAFVSNRVLLDLDRAGLALDDLPRPLEGETVADHLWLPATAQRPFHVQLMCRTYVDDADRALGYGVGMSVYVPMESRAENRVAFDDEPDLSGMPRLRIAFSRTPSDRAAIARARDEVARVAAELGAWDPETDSKVLGAGASLHVTGTVRSGDVEDGTSVCDAGGRVWGFENLHLAGNGVVPTALACNSTLTAAVTALRAARAVMSHLGGSAIGVRA